MTPGAEVNSIISAAIHHIYPHTSVDSEEEAQSQVSFDEINAPIILQNIERTLRLADGEPPLLAFVNVKRSCTLIHGTDAFRKAFPNAEGSKIYCEVITSFDVLGPMHCILHFLTEGNLSQANPYAFGEWAFELGKGRIEGLSRIYSVYEIIVVPRDNWFVAVALREQPGLEVRLTRTDPCDEVREVIVELLDCGRPVFAEWARFEKTYQKPYREFETALIQAREAFQTTRSMAVARKSFREWVRARVPNNYERDLGEKILQEAGNRLDGGDEFVLRQFDLALQGLYDGPAVHKFYYHGLRDAAERVFRRRTLAGSKQRRPGGLARARQGDIDLEALQTEIAREPEDMRLRFAYAGGLSGRGEGEHAEFIRRQLADPYSIEKPEDQALDAWRGFSSPSPDIYYEFRRGFVEQVWCPANHLAALVPLFEKAPILHLNVTPGPPPKGLRQQIFFKRLRSLSLASCEIDDDFIVKILCSGVWDKLLWLSLAFNSRITRRGVDALVEASRNENFPNLRYLDLKGAGFDPREQITVDGGRLGASWMPDEGRNIEKTNGLIEWLHLTDRGTLLELSRFGLVEDPCIARGLIKL